VLAARPVTLYWLHIHVYAWPTIEFEVCCGRGTYVRSLIRDLGERLGTGGCLTALTRTGVGPFTVVSAWSIEALGKATGATEYLMDLEPARKALAPGRVVIPPRPTSCL